MGIAILPCFMGDSDPDLVRVAPFASEHKFDLWLLTHPDLRNNGRIKAFSQFMFTRLKAKQALMEGRCPLFGSKAAEYLA